MKATLVRVIDGAAIAVLAFSVLWMLVFVVQKAVVTWADPSPLPPPGDGWVLGLVIVLAVAIGGLAAGRAHPARSSLTTSVLTLVLVVGGVSAATLLYDTATEYHYLAATDKNIENTEEHYGAEWRDHAARLAAGEQACNWLADQSWGYPPDTPSADRFAGSLGNAPPAWGRTSPGTPRTRTRPARKLERKYGSHFGHGSISARSRRARTRSTSTDRRVMPPTMCTKEALRRSRRRCGATTADTRRRAAPTNQQGAAIL